MSVRTVVLLCIAEEELTHQELLDYVSEFVEVQYVQVECGVNQDVSDDAASSLHHIRLVNVGLRRVIGGGWTIYFNHCGGLNEIVQDDDNLAVRHVEHWLVTLTLLPGRVLGPFSNVTLRYPVRLPSRSYAFPRWYGSVHNSNVSINITNDQFISS